MQQRILAREVAREITVEEAQAVSGGLDDPDICTTTPTMVGTTDGSPTTSDPRDGGY